MLPLEVLVLNRKIKRKCIGYEASVLKKIKMSSSGFYDGVIIPLSRWTRYNAYRNFRAPNSAEIRFIPSPSFSWKHSPDN